MAATEYVLSDDMLRGFAETVRRLRPREPLLPGGLRRPEARRLPDDGGAEGTRRPRHDPRAVLPRAAPARLPRARHRARHQHAPLLGRTGRRSLAPGRPLARVAAEGGDGRRGVQRRPRRARQRPSRSCSPPARPSGWTAASASPATRCSAAWRRSGRATACTRRGRMPMAGRRSCTPSCRAATTATASWRPGTRWACARRAATMWCWRVRSCPTSTSRGSCRPAAPMPSCSASSPGR